MGHFISADMVSKVHWDKLHSNESSKPYYYIKEIPSFIEENSLALIEDNWRQIVFAKRTHFLLFLLV